MPFGERDYSGYTPEDFNRELITLFEQLPTLPVSGHTDQLLAEYARRDNSEHKASIVAILDQLLVHSPTTQAFKRYVRHAFLSAYDVGVENASRLLVCFQDSGRGSGIFARPQCMQIERDEYLKLVGVSKSWLFDPSTTPRVEGTVSLDQELVEWHEQFSQLYGEELDHLAKNSPKE